MDIWNWLGGTFEVEIVSADTASAINRCFSSGVTLYDTRQMDDLTLRCRIRRQDLPSMRSVLEPKGDQIRILGRSGLFWTAASLRKRPVLVLGIAFLIAFACFLPTRVLFIQVTGNSEIPDLQILEKAAECGIYFGADRGKVRSERMKNALLEAMPELQWAGVNTSGCVAIITVREREPEVKKETGRKVSSIVAIRDGVIESCTVSKGTAHCKAGQAVTKGQMLISGYTDCGISIRAEAAEGEVYALTERNIRVCTLSSCQRQAVITATNKKYSLKIGKNRINFDKGSGISDTTCDRIYTENYITLPGGFVLPVAIVTEELTYYRCEETVSEEQEQLLIHFAREYVLEQMVAGQLLSISETTATGGSLLSLEAVYSCREMIGRVVEEEIIKPNGND